MWTSNSQETQTSRNDKGFCQTMAVGLQWDSSHIKLENSFLPGYEGKNRMVLEPMWTITFGVSRPQQRGSINQMELNCYKCLYIQPHEDLDKLNGHAKRRSIQAPPSILPTETTFQETASRTQLKYGIHKLVTLFDDVSIIIRASVRPVTGFLTVDTGGVKRGERRDA